MTARRKLPGRRPKPTAPFPRGVTRGRLRSRAALLAACLSLGACDAAPPEPAGGAWLPSAAASAVHVVEAEHYHAGTLVAAIQAIESGGTVIVDSSGTARGRASVRQVQQLLLHGQAIDADAVEIRRGPDGGVRITPRPAGAVQASAARLAR